MDAGQVQRLPRQAFSNTASVTGIVTNQQGQGLGGVAVVLQNLKSGRSAPAITAGDGSFRYLNLVPGRYQIKATRDGFQPFAQGDINLAAGDVFPLTVKMTPGSNPFDGVRVIPRLPDLGPPELPQPVVVAYDPYRVLISEPPPYDAIEPKPLSPLPEDEQVFASVPNRWGYPTFREYHRYPDFEVPYVDGHFYDPFNRNKLKGDYPIIGNQTFLDITVTSDSFVDGRRLPTPSGLGSASPNEPSSSDVSDSSLWTKPWRFRSTCFTATRRFVPPIGASSSRRR